MDSDPTEFITVPKSASSMKAALRTLVKESDTVPLREQDSVRWQQFYERVVRSSPMCSC